MSIHTEIETRRSAAQPDAAEVKKYRAYARGRQRGTLTAGQQRILRGVLGNRFADNVCGMVLQRIASRVALARFDVAGSDTEQQASIAVLDYLRTLWTMNSMPALSAATHYATLRDGNHAIALSWLRDSGRVQLSRERWWNGDDGVWVAYDDAGRPAYAVKDWTNAQSQRRRTIWYPDRIERYLADGQGWRMINIPGDVVEGIQPGPGQPVPWVAADGSPLGIPLVHFAHQTTPNDGDTARDPAPEYGMSVLDGGVLGLQDEINDVQRDISAAARFAGYQMMYATGIERQAGGGGGSTYHVEPGAMFESENAEARFGTLAPGSLAELERTLTIKLQAVSRSTSVPQHLISGDWPSGEALIRAEQPLVDVAEAAARVFGPAWASVAHRATLMANAFSEGQPTPLDPSLLISAIFLPAERRDKLTLAQTAAAEAPYVSQRETLRTLGKSPDEISRIIAELQQEAIEAAQRSAAAGQIAPSTPSNIS